MTGYPKLGCYTGFEVYGEHEVTDFVRTTGGLLQLKKKQVSQTDVARIAEVAQKLRDAGLAVHAQRFHVVVQKPQLRKQTTVDERSVSEPVDLQAALPAVFSRP